MKICCISDWHGNLNFTIPPSDLILIAGDICGPSEIFKQLSYINGPFKKKFENLGIPIIGTPGNHDWIFEKCPYLEPTWMKWLIDEKTEFEGLKIYGTPYQKRFFDWAFNLDDDLLERKFSFIPEDTQILLLHQPPYGILDLGIHGDHLGSQCLRDRLDELKNLKLVVFGHLHSGYGVEILNGVTFVNAALCDEDYKINRKPIVVEI